MIRLRLAVALACVLLAATVAQASAQDEKAAAEVNALWDRSAELKKAGKLQAAARAYEKALKKARAVLGSDDRDTAILMSNLTGVYHAMRQSTNTRTR
jgi:hypothetical protein